MAHSQLALVSEAEFLALPESTEKVELLDGEVIVSPSPSYWHQEVLARLVTALRAWRDAQRAPFVVGQAPLDVRFGDGRILQPDAFVAAGTVARDHQGPLELVPLVCAEVLSSNRAYDRVTKRYVYAQAGVAEYWVVEPAGVIERWTGPGLAVRQEVVETLTSTVLAGFRLVLADLFA